MTTKIYGWGNDTQALLGFSANYTNGSYPTTYRRVPTKVNDSTDWDKIYLGDDGLSFAIKTDGSLYFSSLYGYFGYTAVTGPFTGWRLSDSGNWVDIAILGNRAYGIKSNGTLWYVGANSFHGQSSSSTWIQVGSATDWSKIAAGGNHVAALKTNGDLYTWGNNNYGSCGQGATASPSNTPVSIGSGFSSIACTPYGTLALKTSDGAVWACGRNAYYDGTSLVQTYSIYSNTKVIAFNAGTAVNATANTITSTAHGFVTGDVVFYNNGGTSTIPGLTNNTEYWIIKVNDNTISLADSEANANAGTVKDITGTGSGTDTLTLVGQSTLTLADSNVKLSKISAAGQGFNNFGVVGVSTTGQLWNWGWTNALGTAPYSNWKRVNTDTDWDSATIVYTTGSTNLHTVQALKTTGALYTYGENGLFGSAGLDTQSAVSTLTAVCTSGCSKLNYIGKDNFEALFTLPSASFTKSTVGNTVTITNTSTDGTSYLVDWGDGSTTAVANNSATGAPGVGTLSHTYSWSTSRTFTIALYAYNAIFANGSKVTDLATDTFAYTVVAPASSFTTSFVGNTVTLTNTSTNAVRYLINWGDETSSTIASNAVPGGVGGGTIDHTYTYSSDSKFVITLTAYSIVFGDGVTLSDDETSTSTFYVTQSPTFTVVEQGSGPSVVVRNTSPNTLGSTAIFGSGNKWRWDWGDTTYTDVNSGSGLAGDRLVNLEHVFSFSPSEIVAQVPVTRTVTLKAYNGHASSPFSSTAIDVTVEPVNPSFPNITFTTLEGADIPAIFNAPKNITWGSST